MGDTGSLDGGRPNQQLHTIIIETTESIMLNFLTQQQARKQQHVTS